ncbi:ATP-binding cassette domain-containing protein [Frankia sp. CNm7]|uniref:ATP-binding cassette domain-containing protein n=1 Tax=Frankia nepalensis TaxID=1836974 RepID=A0A937RPQ6_9ACTN|nr:ATP-binding cassette domain-containing protein [Frankia nepalensis]MBL7500707.1 ATP-binding cassette domain-containing protein [Frankia nepalensis]MBL7514466.1 ATP-binding cassette domain-containing protein [Frankia nepalensis]MBL7523553.1 ATP-binding cassette domain-containing protein [Frankia nepalensis]MBL7632740.1 ATP-binding cassette domain-containing protein [Frankia nepalensis]
MTQRAETPTGHAAGTASLPPPYPLPTATGTRAGPAPAGPAPAGPPAIDVRGLSKRYGRRTVVNDLDLRIPVGAVAGFIGPNGAGKTTTLRMLLGLVRPTTGQGTVLGHPLTDPAGYLPRTGALIENPALYPRLSARRNLEALTILAGRDPAWVDAVLDEVGLAERADDEARSYSLGMKQRLAIAAALLGDPDLLILDEPTNGLDPMGIRLMRDLIRGLAARDGRRRTVLVSSHLLAEVEQICDWIIVVDRGELAYQGPPERLLSAGAPRVTLRPEHARDVGRLADLAAGLGLAVERDGDQLVGLLDPPPAPSADGPDGPAEPMWAALAGLNRAAHAHGITLVEIAPGRVTLEERYTGLVAAAADGARRTGDAS